MSCKECKENPIDTFYRWKNANIEIIACEKHWMEVRDALTEAHVIAKKEREQTIKRVLEIFSEAFNYIGTDTATRSSTLLGEAIAKTKKEFEVE